MAACLASIFEVPIEQVEQTVNIADDEWAQQVDVFAAQYGYAALSIPTCRFLEKTGKAHIVGSLEQAIDVFFPGFADCYCIAYGPGPRGLTHAVVYKGRQMVHDPFSEGSGLKTVEEIIVFVKRGELTSSQIDEV